MMQLFLCSDCSQVPSHPSCGPDVHTVGLQLVPQDAALHLRGSCSWTRAVRCAAKTTGEPERTVMTIPFPGKDGGNDTITPVPAGVAH